MRRILIGTAFSLLAATAAHAQQNAVVVDHHQHLLLPLTDDEFRAIANNVAPYMR